MAATAEVQMRSPMPAWWRWFVLVACLYMNLVVNGYTYCFGLVKIPLMQEYPEVSPMMMAILGGAVPSIYMFMAPVAIAVSEFVGPRTTTIFAGLLSGSCFIGAWANGSFLHWGFGFDLFCLGIGQGIAFGFLYGPSIAVLPNYFRLDQLAFAAGIANAGSSIGVIIYGFISNPLFGIFGWRGTMLFYAAISLHAILAGLAFVPMVPVKEPSPAANTEMVEQGNGGAQEALLPATSTTPQKLEAPKKEFLPILRRFFDLNLFKQWAFVSLIISAGLSIVGYFVTTLLLPGEAKDPKNGVHPDIASNIMAIFGILNLTGRIVLGRVGDLGFRFAIFSAYWLYIASLVLGATCFLIFPHVMHLGTVPFVIFAVSYGFSAAPIIINRSLLTTTLFGKKNASASYGWFLCAQGGLQIVGYILPAWLDATFGPVYAYSFGALMFLLSAFCCAITFKPYFSQRRKQIQEMADDNTKT